MKSTKVNKILSFLIETKKSAIILILLMFIASIANFGLDGYFNDKFFFKC